MVNLLFKFLNVNISKCVCEMNFEYVNTSEEGKHLT